jgi:UDP-2,3-diacylglucosamine pyrophosphatase LpxH
VILEAQEDRLLVISDLHLGNPASTARGRLLDFLDWVAHSGSSLCINGDGFEMLQTSFTRLAADAVPVLDKLRKVMASGGRVYYVVGNHDIVLEHFLEDFLVELSPFLNVRSGGARIRVEHGHIYDPFFARYPDLYELSTRVAGYVLFLNKDVYRLWTQLQRHLDARRRRLAGDDTLAISYGHEAADMLMRRGFDTVVFGHTHHPEVAQLDRGTYINSGNWLRDRTYVDIDHGSATLKTWEPWRGR